MIAVVDQTGVGPYPVSLTKIKEEDGKELSGYFYLNTSSPFGYNFLYGQKLVVSVQIKDKAGHTSQPVSLSVLFGSGEGPKSPPAGVFNEKELGPIMVTLRPPSARTQ
jgi:hypothetical protein